MEAIQGCTKTLSFQADVLCNACGMFVMLLEVNTFLTCQTVSGGSGVPPGTKPKTCKRCKGSGKVSIMLELI